MKNIVYIIICAVLFAACQQNEVPNLSNGECILELQVSYSNKATSTTRAVDSDLTVKILDADGNLYRLYSPGTIPAKIVLEPGTFEVCAYTDNQETWQEANSGKGEPCYYVSKQITMEYDEIKRVSISVPMVNYGVSLALPEYFHDLFNTHTFTLTSGTKQISIQEGEKAYFNPVDNSFTYALQATNTDGATHSHSAIEYTGVQSGKLYVVKYAYGLDSNTGGVDIEIKDDMQMEDTDVEI